MHTVEAVDTLLAPDSRPLGTAARLPGSLSLKSTQFADTDSAGQQSPLHHSAFRGSRDNKHRNSKPPRRWWWRENWRPQAQHQLLHQLEQGTSRRNLYSRHWSNTSPLYRSHNLCCIRSTFFYRLCLCNSFANILQSSYNQNREHSIHRFQTRQGKEVATISFSVCLHSKGMWNGCTAWGDDFPRALREGKTAMIIEESAVCCLSIEKTTPNFRSINGGV